MGWYNLIIGLIFPFLLIYWGIRDAIHGVRSVNGTVFGEEKDNIYIRYKIRDSNYYEVSCSKYSSYFILGPPEVGTKIVLKVKKDDPYKVVSIHLVLKSKLTSFAKDGTYSNNYVWKKPLMLLPWSAFLITTGILNIIGIL